MMRTIGLLLFLAVLLSGCKSQSSTPNFFAPVGPSRIPPPSTGSIQPGGQYYQSPAQPSSALPSGLGRTSPGQSNITDLSPTNLGSRPGGASSGSSTVQLANDNQSFARPSASGSTSSSTSSLLRSKLQPMRVNDATSSGNQSYSEPRPFSQSSDGLIDISQLPDAKPAQVRPAPPVWPYRSGAVDRSQTRGWSAKRQYYLADGR